MIFGDVRLHSQLTRISKPTNAVLPPGVSLDEARRGLGGVAGTAPADAYDTAIVNAVLSGGGLVSVVSGWSLNHPTGVDWQMFGSDGMLRMSGAAFPEALEGAAVGERGVRSLLDPATGAVNLYAALATDLRLAVADRTHQPTFATIEDGLRLQEILDVITEPDE